MNINDDLITLRAIEPDDNMLLLEMINNSDIEKKVNGWSFPHSLNNQEHWYNSFRNSLKDVKLIIEWKGQSVGMIGATNIDLKNDNANVHIKLCETAPKRKGIGFKAMNMFCEYLFNEFNLHLVYANILENNKESKGLFLKLGFSQEGISKERVFKSGNYHDVIHFVKFNGRNQKI